METTGADFLPINDGILGRPDPPQAAPGMLDDFYFPVACLLDPFHQAAFVVGTIGPDQFEPRQAALQWLQEVSAPCMILHVGFVDQHMQDQPSGIDEQMPLAARDAFAAVVATRPPF